MASPLAAVRDLLSSRGLPDLSDALLAPPLDGGAARVARYFVGAGDAELTATQRARLAAHPLLVADGDGHRARVSGARLVHEARAIAGGVVVHAAQVEYVPLRHPEAAAAARAALAGEPWGRLRALPDELPLDLFLAFEALADERVYDEADLRARLAANDEAAWCLLGLAACLPDADYRALLAACVEHPDEHARGLVAREAVRLELPELLRRAVRAGIDVATLDDLLLE